MQVSFLKLLFLSACLSVTCSEVDELLKHLVDEGDLSSFFKVIFPLICVPLIFACFNGERIANLYVVPDADSWQKGELNCDKQDIDTDGHYDAEPEVYISPEGKP